MLEADEVMSDSEYQSWLTNRELSPVVAEYLIIRSDARVSDKFIPTDTCQNAARTPQLELEGGGGGGGWAWAPLYGEITRRAGVVSGSNKG